MDTTWNVMGQYVTAMLMAVFFNVGIPLALAFGPGETTELSSMFDASVLEPFQIDLSNYVMESDQGSALEAIAHEHHPGRHLLCLRRFLSGLKIKRFNFEVGNLVKARSHAAFELVKASYDIQIPSIEEPRDRIQYGRLLNKAGLAIENKSIVITNLGLWRKVSIWQKIQV
jgi:hypothetical protein